MDRKKTNAEALTAAGSTKQQGKQKHEIYGAYQQQKWNGEISLMRQNLKQEKQKQSKNDKCGKLKTADQQIIK